MIIFKKGRKTTDRTGDKYNINLSFILSTYRILIQIDNNYQLDLRSSEFGDGIGFSEKIVKKKKQKLEMICPISQILYA